MPDIHGNLSGIKDSTLREIQALYDYPIGGDEYLPPDLARMAARYSSQFNREISLYISRDGELLDITIGDTDSVPLSEWRLRRSQNRLSRVRCVHTHPRGGANLSDVDLTALKSLWLDSMAALGVDDDGRITGVNAAFLSAKVGGEPQPVLLPIISLGKLPQEQWMEMIRAAEEQVKLGEDKPINDGPEKALIVGIDSEKSLDELQSLCESAGAEVVGRLFQNKGKPDSATYIGSGKADELAQDAQALEADVVVVDDELTGAQIRNLEALVKAKVVDRTTLILDIFAQRAKSAEGRLQVSLAQLKYQSGRLIGQGLVLSRLGGGIGTRGPGESKLEIDRRRIREHITELRRELETLQEQRTLRRKNRKRNAVPVVALVGYTNTGKSTLLNKISGADVYVKDQLFATLDAVSRKVPLPGGREFLLVDTVGFINKLPHDLVEAFHSTLEEAVLADILVLVHDASSPDIAIQQKVVEEVLEDLGAIDQPRIHVLNKCDAVSGDMLNIIPGAIRISAKTGEGLGALLEAIAAPIRKAERKVTLLVPFSQYGMVSELRAQGRIVGEEHEDTGTRVTVMLDTQAFGRLASRYGSLFTQED
jgi:GTPase